MIIFVMGVSGSGKTTIGQLLAERLNYHFADADDWHSDLNRHKMSQGIPLTDGDRHSWLDDLRTSIDSWIHNGENVVLACSALKQTYRDRLSNHHFNVQWVYLNGRFEVIQQRLNTRTDHFMSAMLLESQFAALEEPDDAIVVDIEQETDAIVSAIATHVES
ncbi:MAG: gluconokinase [Cyanobacteria bacterium J06633_2]